MVMARFRSSPLRPAVTTATGSVAIFASVDPEDSATSKNSVAVGPGQRALTFTPFDFSSW
jgi:hypothetical protein